MTAQEATQAAARANMSKTERAQLAVIEAGIEGAASHGLTHYIFPGVIAEPVHKYLHRSGFFLAWPTQAVNGQVQRINWP